MHRIASELRNMVGQEQESIDVHLPSPPPPRPFPPLPPSLRVSWLHWPQKDGRLEWIFSRSRSRSRGRRRCTESAAQRLVPRGINCLIESFPPSPPIPPHLSERFQFDCHFLLRCDANADSFFLLLLLLLSSLLVLEA
jgi:hypothetical protein